MDVRHAVRTSLTFVVMLTALYPGLESGNTWLLLSAVAGGALVITYRWNRDAFALTAFLAGTVVGLTSADLGGSGFVHAAVVLVLAALGTRITVAVQHTLEEQRAAETA